MNKLLIICGPTATGKTALGIKLAKRFNGEVVSVDSRQVYKGMDIGTGKDLPENSKFKLLNSKKFQISNFKFQIGYYLIKGVRVWLYDVIEPDYRFNIADYIKCANLVIKDIWQRKKLPILVGGTGFYIKGLIDGIETLGISPDWKLRKKLSSYSIDRLVNFLKKINPERWESMNEADRKNPRRLIRAIEVTLKLKNQPPNWQKKVKTKFQTLKTKPLFIGLTAPYKILYQRIDQRVKDRIKKGIEKEINSLLEKGYNWENSVLGETIGYKEWQDFFNKKLSFQEVINRWRYAEHAYARRQMIWFKKDKRIFWFDITEKSWQNKVIKKVKEWLNEGKDSKN